MGEVLEAAVKPQEKEKHPQYSDKFAGAKTISEHFAWNLAKASDNIVRDRKDLTIRERTELEDALRDFAEYEIENDAHKIIGEKASGQFELVLGRFELDDARTRISAYAEKRMAKSDEVEALKKHGVYQEFKSEVQTSLEGAINAFVKQNDNKQAEIVQKNDAAIPAKEVNGTLVTQEATLTAPAK